MTKDALLTIPPHRPGAQAVSNRNLQVLINYIANPETRTNLLSLIPAHHQKLITDRDYQLQILGQDGIQTAIDWQECVRTGKDIPNDLSIKINALRDKLNALNG